MTKSVYFFDSYAIIEIVKGSESYKKYTDSSILTTKMNLFEVYQTVVQLFSENEADEFLENCNSFLVDYDFSIIKQAALMRIKLKKRNISMVDCIGYCTAQKLGILFLTGDKEFEHFEGVEFVK